jgi:hypothetical protein
MTPNALLTPDPAAGFGERPESAPRFVWRDLNATTVCCAVDLLRIGLAGPALRCHE